MPAGKIRRCEPLRRATADDPPLDASHAAWYDTHNYGFAPTSRPAADPDVEIPDGAADPDIESQDGEGARDAAPDATEGLTASSEQQNHVETTGRDPFWARWPRRGRSRRSRDRNSTSAEPA